ncbi:hypothetical protein VCSRO82_3266 [Vibrio cholerae]|uniref:hypothetical protein n=1 Tax=Vibrio cholerae TaxID=666 RepID=UPI0011D9912E|nr:hypothetical protein [Vibrio cholerae]TXZ36681.1 hypothetical protein FXE69_02165 [Vibrio cholerae]GHZ91015.1 hypothetical protein VCSRO82_3266 [Vibrio cholerae]
MKLSSILPNFLSPKANQPAKQKRTVSKNAPQWKELGKLAARNVRGIFDTVECAVYLDTGDVIILDTKINSRTNNNRQKISAEVQKWASYRGLIKDGECIAIR